MKPQLDLRWERFIKRFSDVQDERIEGPRQTKGFPHEMIQVMGRPKPAKKWGFKDVNDTPGKVVKIL